MVWIVGIIVTSFNNNTDSSYYWESLGWKAILLEAVGFIILLSGNLIYNEIIPFARPPKSILKYKIKKKFIQKTIFLKIFLEEENYEAPDNISL